MTATSAGRQRLRRHSSVAGRLGLRRRHPLKEARALRQRVRMADHAADALERRARQRHERMVDLQPQRADDVEAVLLHEVVDARHRAGRRVLHRQHAVGAHPLLDRLEHALEAVEVDDRRRHHHLRGSLLGERALRAATGDERTRREPLRPLLHRAVDLGDERRVAVEDAPLPRLGDREERGEEEPRRVLVPLVGLGRDPREDLALARRVGYRRARLALLKRHFADKFHPLEEELHQPLVDDVHPLSRLVDVLHFFLPFPKPSPSPRQRRA